MVYLCLAQYEFKEVCVARGHNAPISVAWSRLFFPHDDTHPLEALNFLGKKIFYFKYKRSQSASLIYRTIQGFGAKNKDEKC
ncbi:hypothetical protein Y032_0059g3062 [Ancylostoma ceylanicum]|uniref:Uncharacterized protein n=1 Tax=Ancylostoma ceylanicum TaxID=53326 RepID=A0A016U4A2_9BILA|nr:hypothetical protein Y032_0059g3062 [Ancylostoma ceylanicum]